MTSSVPGVLIPADDLPLHQTSLGLAHTASGDANHYDRYFFNGYTSDGSLYFGAAMGLYPNRQVIDAAFSVVRNGEQINVHASGRCPLDRSTAVGPITVRIDEPLQTLTVIVAPGDHDIAAEVTFRARTAPVEEPRFTLQREGRGAFDYTRLTQWGAWEGWIEVDGERIEVRPTEVLGSRDRSWGTRPVGERTGAGAPAPAPQFFWLWAPVNFERFCTHFDVNEWADGSRWHESAFVVPVGDGTPEPMRTANWRGEWEVGTRRMRWCEIDLVPWHGEATTVRLDAIINFQMLGLGYLHPTRGHGVWQGESSVLAERFALPVADPCLPHHVHVQTLCRATYDGHEGIGILEQLVIGPHEPSGISGFFDPHP